MANPNPNVNNSNFLANFGLSDEDIEAFKQDFNCMYYLKFFNNWIIVTEKELRRLQRRFNKLDADGSGSLSTEEFSNIPELASNPLLERIISIFDTNKNEEIEFHG